LYKHPKLVACLGMIVLFYSIATATFFPANYNDLFNPDDSKELLLVFNGVFRLSSLSRLSIHLFWRCLLIMNLRWVKLQIILQWCWWIKFTPKHTLIQAVSSLYRSLLVNTQEQSKAHQTFEKITLNASCVQCAKYI